MTATIFPTKIQDVQITPLDAPLGAVVTGLDASQAIDPATILRLKQAHRNYHILIFKNQKLTDERLVKCEWHPCPDIFCRTGDLGRILEDGNIQYHGRKDNMVKTRGYRVEIDEVELALSSIAGVAQAAVVAVSDAKYTNTLHAFVQADGSQATIESIKAALEKKLPSYMIPFTFRTVDDFPKTSTAKIDRVGLRQIIENEKRAA
jgi:acyl-coenzyme A synthetase/AMP-(fatty) acid ligase